jgi:uncharacterized protein
MAMIEVIKQDHTGKVVWRYSGRVLHRDEHEINLEAFFDREDILIGEIVLKQGDRFIETYYNDRWYNIFEIYSRTADTIKGWYCNITSPAQFGDDCLSYRDLALDLLVYPDGRQVVLDEDEFEQIELDKNERDTARQTLDELRQMFRE